MQKIWKRLLIGLAVIVIIVIGIRLSGLHEYLSLQKIQAKSAEFKMAVESNYWLCVMIFLSICAFTIFLALPTFPLIGLMGGFLFGFFPGLLYANFGSTAGATIYFFCARYFFGDMVRVRYGAQLASFKKKIDLYGANYLLFLYFISVVPFVIVSTLAALAHVSSMTFVWTTFVGCLPLCAMYAFAGKNLATIKQLSDIIKPGMLVLLLILAVFVAIMMMVQKHMLKKELHKDSSQ